MAYFPNGSSGEVFDAQCADCPLGYGWNDPRQQTLFDDERAPLPCPIAFVQLTYNYEQLGAGQEKLREAMTCLVSDSGECKTRSLLVQLRRDATR